MFLRLFLLLTESRPFALYTPPASDFPRRFCYNDTATVLRQTTGRRNLFQGVREAMQKIITFDCYGTLLDTRPLYRRIGEIAEENGLSAQTAVHVFESYEDRLMYGEEFISFDVMLREILSYCDMEMNADVFSAHGGEAEEVVRSFRPFDDVIDTLTYLKSRGCILALLSNTTNAFMRQHIRALGDLPDAA